jgi:hypothetical protein
LDLILDDSVELDEEFDQVVGGFLIEFIIQPVFGLFAKVKDDFTDRTKVEEHELEQ